MAPTYTSLEDGQVITSDEPRPDLDALARWQRDDVTPEPVQLNPATPSQTPVAGPVNTSPVTGGNPPMTSATAGIVDPANTLSQEEAAKRAAEQLAAAADGDDEPERPALNGTTEEWAEFAKHERIALDVADDAGRDAIIAAYIEKFVPAGNASGKDWTDYARQHGVTVDEKDGRDNIRAAVIEAGWAKA